MNSASSKSNQQQQEAASISSPAEFTSQAGSKKSSHRISHENYQKRQGRLIKKSLGRISNNEDISDSSQLTQINSIANASTAQAHLQQLQMQIVSHQESDSRENRFESRGKNALDNGERTIQNSAMAQRQPHGNDLGQLRQDTSNQFAENRTNNGRNSLSPHKLGRSTDMFFGDNQTEEQKLLQAQDESIQTKRLSSGIMNEADAANIQLDSTGVCHLNQHEAQAKYNAIKNQRVLNCRQFSNDLPLMKVNETAIETHRQVYTAETPTETQNLSLTPVEIKKSSPLRVSTTSVKRIGPANEQIISIFDGETEKSYLLERKDNKDGAGNVFKVQEVGTARFKCLPVTDYGKIMSLHKQRQQKRKVQTANGSRAKITRAHSSNNNGAVPRSYARKPNRCMSNRGSQETFNALRCVMPGQVSEAGDGAVARWQEPLSPTSTGGAGTTQAFLEQGIAGQPLNENIFLQNGGVRSCEASKTPLSDQGHPNSNGAITSAGRELRNSRSTAASGQQRKEVFSKTLVTNEQGVTLTQKHHFRGGNAHQHAVSSRGLQAAATTAVDVLGAAVQAQMLSGDVVYHHDHQQHIADNKLFLKHLQSGHRNTGGRKLRTSTARITTMGTATGGGVESERAQCCCPTIMNDDVLSAKTATLGSGGAYLSPQMFNCLRHERVKAAATILNDSGAAFGGRSSTRVQQNKSMRKRAQSHGGASRPMRTLHETTFVGGVPPSQLVSSRRQQLQHQPSPWSNAHVSSRVAVQHQNLASTALISIQPDSRKKTLPNQQSSQMSQQVIKQRLSSYLSLLVGGTSGNHNKMRRQVPQVKSILALGEDLGGNYNTLNEILEQVRQKQVQTDEMTELIAGLELVDNVKPLRNTIIDSVRAMPSYYAGRVRKDPVKLKQFEMQVGEPTSASNTDRLDWKQQRQASRSTSPCDVVQTKATTLQSLINHNRMLTINAATTITNGAECVTEDDILNRNKKNMMAISADEFERTMFKKGLASPSLIKTQKNEQMRRDWANRRVTEKATSLNNVAKFVKREPPTSVLIKAKKGRRQRCDDGTKQSQTARCLPRPENQINKQYEELEEGANNKTAHFSNEMGLQLQAANQGIRKSLTLIEQISGASKVDSDSSHRAPNFSSGLDEMSLVKLMPRDNHILNPALATSSDPATLNHSQDFVAGQSQNQNHNQMIGQSAIQVLLQNSFGGGFEHQGFPVASETSFGNGGQDLTHVMRNSLPANNLLNSPSVCLVDDPSSAKKLQQHQQQLMMVSGTAVSPSANQPQPISHAKLENQQKMVKTYEFHLPMHHIREEEPQTNTSAKPATITPGLRCQQIATQSRYDSNKPGSAYRMAAKKKTSSKPAQLQNNPAVLQQQQQQQFTNKRDDISSQMLENETVADQQNSLRNLNIMGSSFYGEAQNVPGGTKQRMHYSQTAICKRASQKVPSRRNNLAQSLEGPISLQNSGEQKKVAKSSQQNQLDCQSNNESGVECVECVEQVGHSGLGAGCALHTINDSVGSREEKRAAQVSSGAAVRCTSETTKHHNRGGSQSIRFTPNNHTTSPILQNPARMQTTKNNQRAETVFARHPPLNQLTHQEHSKYISEVQSMGISQQSAKNGGNDRPQTIQTQEAKSLDIGKPTASARQLKSSALSSQSVSMSPRETLPEQSSRQQQMSFACKGGAEDAQPLSNLSPEKLAESLQRQIESFQAQSPTPKTYDAFVILQTTNEGGQSELLEINQKNFELFGKQLDSGMKLTTSSMSAGCDDHQQCLSQGLMMLDSGVALSSQQDPQEHESGRIEIINISQAVQTKAAATAVTAGRDESCLTDQATPQISRLFVIQNDKSSNADRNTGDQADYKQPIQSHILHHDEHHSSAAVTAKHSSQPSINLPRSQESRIRFLEQLLSLNSDQTGPQVQQVRLKQFETRKILPEHHKSKSSRGYPSMGRKLQKQFKQPHFKNAQAYMEKQPTMLNELRGEKRFKTFRANNELYYRIETSSNVEMKEQNIYDSLIEKLGSSLPPEMMKNHSSQAVTSPAETFQPADNDDLEEQTTIPDDEEADDTVDVKDTEREVKSFSEQPQTTLSPKVIQQQAYQTNGSQLEDRSSDDTSKQRQSNFGWKDDTRPLLPIQTLQKPERDNVDDLDGEEVEEEDDQDSTSKMDGPSQQLEDQEGISTVKKNGANSNALRFKSQRRSRMGDNAHIAITKGIHQGQPTFTSGNKRLSQNITQPVLWQVEKMGGGKRKLISRGETTLTSALVGSNDEEVITLCGAASNRAPISPKIGSQQVTPKGRNVFKQQSQQHQQQCVVVQKKSLQSSSSPKRIATGTTAGGNAVRITTGGQNLRKNHRRVDNFQATIQGTNPVLKQQRNISPSILQLYNRSDFFQGTINQLYDPLAKTFGDVQLRQARRDQNTSPVDGISQSASDSPMHTLPMETPQMASAKIIVPAQPVKSGGQNKSRSKTMSSRQENLYQPSMNQRQLNDLVLQVFADKKHNRRHFQTIDGSSTATLGTGKQGTTANSDIPFNLKHKASSSQRSIVSASAHTTNAGMITTVPPKRQTVHVASHKTTSGKTGVRKPPKVANPDLLRNILSKDRAAPVIVPRSNQNIYQVLSGQTGFDRTINYINYDQKQQQMMEQQSMYALAFANAPEQEAASSRQDIDEQYLGWPQQMSQQHQHHQHLPHSAFTSDQLYLNEFGMEIPASHRSGFSHMSSEHSLKLELQNQTSFGSMILGKPCLESGNWKQEYLHKYPQATICMLSPEEMARDASGSVDVGTTVGDRQARSIGTSETQEDDDEDQLIGVRILKVIDETGKINFQLINHSSLVLGDELNHLQAGTNSQRQNKGNDLTPDTDSMQCPTLYRGATESC